MTRTTRRTGHTARSHLHREIARDQHKEDIRVFNEVINVEKALLKQLVQAVPELYLKSFRNTHSNSITILFVDVL